MALWGSAPLGHLRLSTDMPVPPALLKPGVLSPLYNRGHGHAPLVQLWWSAAWVLESTITRVQTIGPRLYSQLCHFLKQGALD